MTHFIDDVWNEIKEFMGIYNITTEWYKLEKVGAIRLNEFFKDNYSRRITNASYSPDTTRKMIYKRIFKRMTLNEANNLYKLIAPKIYDTKNVKVGDEITYENYENYRYNYFSGIVVKINKCSIRFKPYRILKKVSNNPNAIRDQTHENITVYWDKNNFDKCKTIKKFKCKDDENFNPDFYTEFCDYGN